MPDEIKNKNEIAWEAPEFIHYPKNKLWFAILGILGLALLVYFSLQKDFLTAALFLLLLILIFYFSSVKPKILKIQLDAQGIKLNNLRLSYQQIKNFWIVYDPPVIKILNFETTAFFNRYLTLQLGNEDPRQIRKFLLEYLPEDLDRGEQFADKLGRTLKF